MNNLQPVSVHDLLPQRTPFVMVDALTYLDETTTRTTMNVTADNIFVDDNKFSEAGIIENIAQTCAARMGYINKFLVADQVKLGFIGAIKNLIIEELPKVGDRLNTTVEVMSEVFTVTMVNAKVEIGEKLIASCEMKISLTDIDSQTNE